VGPASATVVVVAICSGRHLARCLDALEAQTGAPPFDVVVAHDPRLADVPALTRRYSRVRLAPTGSAWTPADLAARAIPAASGDLVILTEDHCEPCSDWVHQLTANQALERGAVGGTVEPRPGASLVNWAFCYADFFRFVTPVAAGPARALTVCNVAYRRRDLEAIAPIWRRRFLETEVNAALARRAGPLWLVPAARVRTWRRVGLIEGARERYALGRLFAAARVAGAGPGRRLFWSTLAPGLPVLLLARMTVRALTARPLLVPFIRALAPLILFTLAWSWGEWIGYVTRRGPRELTIARRDDWQ
jgi:hypothetical protein